MQTMQRKIITLAITLATVLSAAGSIVTISPSLAFATVVTPDFAAGFTNCPFEAQADRTIVTFDGIKLHTSTSFSTTLKDANLVAGTYKVSLHSYDGYADRATDPYGQSHEQWLVKFLNADNDIIAQSNAIDDLANGVMEASLTQEVNDTLVLSEDVTKVQGWHAFPEDADSVGAVCAAFDLIEAAPEPTELTIKATKIVCDSEADLPDWSKLPGGPNITESTASVFLSENSSCHPVADWDFQWATESTPNPGDNEGEIGGAWTSFTSSTDVNGESSITIPFDGLGSYIWVREAMREGYLPFSGTIDTNENSVSAEFVCHTDVVNYDNYDAIEGIEVGNTYYCVGFNVLTEEVEEGCVNTCPTPDSLGDTDDEEIQNSDEKPLQDILNDEGYTLDVNDDQEEFQVWNVASGDTVNVTAKFLDEEAGYTSIFGYYIDGDTNTFVPIFRTGESVTYNTVTLGIEGTSYSIEASGATSIAFAIKVEGEAEELISTKNNENDGNSDQVIVYNPVSNEYILAFEDIIGGDQDFNDVVVRINTSCDDNSGGGHEEEPFTADITVDDDDLTINEGDTRQLNWNTTGAWECTIEANGDVDGLFPMELNGGNLNGHTDVSPEVTTTYTLTCNDGDDNLINDEVTLTVIPTPACADENDNDSDSLTDSADPGCHSDGDAENVSSYDPEDNDETDTPDGDGGGDDTDGIGGDPGNDEDNNEGSSNRGGGRRRSGGGSSNAGQVLGASTGPATCGIYLTTFIKFGASNDTEEVKKLQSFLNEVVGSNLPITGFYGPLTKAAVDKFQVMYGEEILLPWIKIGLHDSINNPTSYVYKTTQRMINNLVCPALNLPMPNLP